MNFSVLISIFDKEKTENYDSCLASLAQQSLKASEIIVVHDGFIGGPLLSIEEKYKDSLPLHIVPLKVNQGLGKALNEGLRHCSYDIVLRMDTDDVCVRDRFQKQILFLECNPNIDICGSSIYEFDKSIDNIYAERKLPTVHKDIVEFAKSRCPFNHMTVAYRKKVVLQVGGYQDLPHMEDYYLWIRVVLSGAQCANLAEPLVYVRAGEDMIIKRGGWQYVKSELYLINYMLQRRFISLLQWTKLLIIRIPIRLMPLIVRKNVYCFIRTKVKNVAKAEV